MFSEVVVLFIKLLIHIYITENWRGLLPCCRPSRIYNAAFERMAALAAEGSKSDADSEAGDVINDVYRIYPSTPLIVFPDLMNAGTAL
jgi:hypothetical protein